MHAKYRISSLVQLSEYLVLWYNTSFFLFLCISSSLGACEKEEDFLTTSPNIPRSSTIEGHDAISSKRRRRKLNLEPCSPLRISIRFLTGSHKSPNRITLSTFKLDSRGWDFPKLFRKKL